MVCYSFGWFVFDYDLVAALLRLRCCVTFGSIWVEIFGCLGSNRLVSRFELGSLPLRIGSWIFARSLSSRLIRLISIERWVGWNLAQQVALFHGKKRNWNWISFTKQTKKKNWHCNWYFDLILERLHLRMNKIPLLNAD